MPEWKASATDYQYLDRNPDPNVTPVRVHWRVEETDGTLTGSVYGADAITDMPTFPESSMIRVTESVMINWLHGEYGAEWVQEKEQIAADQLAKLQNPDYGSTPPEDV